MAYKVTFIYLFKTSKIDKYLIHPIPSTLLYHKLFFFIFLANDSCLESYFVKHPATIQIKVNGGILLI